MLSQRQPGLLPLLEVLGCVDGAANVALRPHTPVLGESCRADDARLVDSPFTPDFVRSAVAVESAVTRVVGVVGWVVLVTEVFDNVILDQWVGGPAVEA